MTALGPPTASAGSRRSSRTAARGEFVAPTLSGREREILAVLAEGLATKEIAHRLGISAYTVSNHRRRIAKKLSVSGAALVAWAVKFGAGSENG